MRTFYFLVFLLTLAAMPSITHAADNWWFEEDSLNGHTLHSEDFSSGTGYVVGSSGYAAKTTDYGKSWTDISDSGTSGYFYGVSYFGGNAYAVGSNGSTIRKYTSSSGTWSSISSGTSSGLNGIASYSSSLYAVGDSGKIVRSTNSGSSFSALTSPTSTTLNTIAQSGGEFWAVGYSGTVVRKSASSTTFSSVSSGTTSTLWGVDVYYKTGSPTVWISGTGGLLKKTTNGGTSWETIVVDGAGTNTIYDIDFQGDYGIATTDSKIFFTDDGGDTWEEMELDGGTFPSYINDISISNTGSALFMRAAGSGFFLFENSTPTAASGLSVSGGSPTTDTTPTFTWTAANDSLSALTYTLTLDGTSSAASSMNFGESTSTTWATTLADDVYAVSLTAVDESGNASPTATTSLTVDTAGPTITLLDGGDGQVGEAYSVSAWVSDVSGVTSCQALLEGEEETVDLMFEATLIMWTGSFTPTVAGDLELLVECEDGAGHTREARQDITFAAADTGDTTAPSVSIVSPTDWVERYTTTAVTATVTDNVAVSQCDLYNNGSLWDSMTVSGQSATVMTEFEDSAASITVRCTDTSGNLGISAAVALEVLSEEEAIARESEDSEDDTGDMDDDTSTDSGTDSSDDASTGAGSDETALIADDEAVEGTLIKLACDETQAVGVNDPCKAVYFYGGDGKRHAFTNEKVYFTWYEDFDDVIIVSGDYMSDITLGSNVTYHPGTRMVKFLSVPTVYTVSRGGVLRAIASEEIATALYGSNWNQQIDDISDAFLGNYSFGEDIDEENDYDIDEEEASADTIDDSLPD